MRKVHGLISVLLFAAIAISANAQKIDPRTDVRWSLLTGSGSPTSTGASCITNYGQPYQDTSVTPNIRYHCAPTGWEQDGTSGSTLSLITTDTTSTVGGPVPSLTILSSILGLPTSQTLITLSGNSAAPNSVLVDVFPPGYGSFTNGLIFEDFATSNAAIILGRAPTGTFSQAIEFHSANFNPTQLYSNSGTLTVGGNGFFLAGSIQGATRIQAIAAGTANSGTNYNSALVSWVGSYYNGSAATNDSWTIQEILRSGTTPHAALNISHSGYYGTSVSLFQFYDTGNVAINQNGVLDPGYNLWVNGTGYFKGSVGIEGANGSGNALTAPSLYANTRIQAMPSCAATSGSNCNSSLLEINAAYWNGTASTQETWIWQDYVGTGTTPTAVLSLAHSNWNGVSGPLLSVFNTGDVGVGVGYSDGGYLFAVNGTSYFGGAMQVSNISSFSTNYITALGLSVTGASGSGNSVAAPSLYANTRIQAMANCTATSGSNCNSSLMSLVGSYWNGTAATGDNWSWQNYMGSGTTPTALLLLTHNSWRGNTGMFGIYDTGNVAIGYNTGADPGYMLYVNGTANFITSATTPSLYATTRLQASPTGTAISGTNYNSALVNLSASYYNAGALNDTWTLYNIIGSGTTPTSTLNVGHSGSSGTTLVNVVAPLEATSYQIGSNIVIPSGITGYHGSSGTKVQMSDGTGPSGNLAKFASDGSVTDSGSTTSSFEPANSMVSLRDSNCMAASGVKCVKYIAQTSGISNTTLFTIPSSGVCSSSMYRISLAVDVVGNVQAGGTIGLQMKVQFHDATNYFFSASTSTANLAGSSGTSGIGTSTWTGILNAGTDVVLSTFLSGTASYPTYDAGATVECLN